MAVAEAPGLPVGQCAQAVTVSISQDIDSFQREPRCRVCRSDGLSKKVNDMLARGASYAGIVRTLSLENAALDEHDRVTVHSVRNHADRHFPVQNAAKAAYREILGRRAQGERRGLHQRGGHRDQSGGLLRGSHGPGVGGPR